MNIDKLTEFRARNNGFATHAAAMAEAINEVMTLLPAFLEHAKLHFAEAPYPDGDDRNRATALAQHVGYNTKVASEQFKEAKALCESIANGAKSSNEIVARLLGDNL